MYYSHQLIIAILLICQCLRYTRCIRCIYTPWFYILEHDFTLIYMEDLLNQQLLNMGSRNLCTASRQLRSYAPPSKIPGYATTTYRILGSIKNIHLYIFRNLNFVFSVLICRSSVLCILALGSGQRLLYRLGSGLGLVLVLRFCAYRYGGVYS